MFVLVFFVAESALRGLALIVQSIIKCERHPFGLIGTGVALTNPTDVSSPNSANPNNLTEAL
jgi:hypothetical protein